MKPTTKKLTAIIVACMMALTMIPSVAFAQEQVADDAGYVPSDLIVVYKDKADCTKALEDEGFDVTEKASKAEQQLAEETIEPAAQEAGASVKSGEFIADSMPGNGAALAVTVGNEKQADQLKEVLEDDPQVAYVQRNYKYELFEMSTSEDAALAAMSTTTNDIKLSSQYYLGSWDSTSGANCGANVLAAWDKSRCDKKVTVAVLDSGVDSDHPDLTANLDLENAAGTSSKGARFRTYDELGSAVIEDISEDGHGSHVAGIVAAVANNSEGIAGASHNAEVLPIRVFDENGRCYSVDLINAYEYMDSLIGNGKMKNLRVINMSLGIETIYNDRNEFTDLGVEDLISHFKYDHKILTVCAAGNKYSTRYTVPGDYEDCFCVTALEKDGTDASFSNYNKHKDISAPGRSLASLSKTGGYANMSGTSMASPLVAGIMALVFAKNPGLSVDQAVTAAENSAVKVKKGGYYHGTATGSKGAIDAAATLDYVDNEILHKTSIESATVTLLQDEFTYNGQEIKPQIEVSGIGPDDYSVMYSSNVNAGTGRVIVNGENEYKGTIIKEFQIKPVEITDMSISSISYEYDGTAKTPKVTVEGAGKNDYTVEYSDNINVGTATVTVTGKNNYSGSCEKTFTINPKDISGEAVSFEGSITYTGKEICPKIKSSLNSNYLNVSYDNNVNVGTANVTITGVDNYIGTIETTFTIKKGTPSLKLSSSAYYYDGKTHRPSVSTNSSGMITNAGGKLPKTYTVSVAGTDNYNAVSKKYSIIVRPTSISSLSRASKAFTVKVSKKPSVNVSGYQCRYSTSSKMTSAKTVTIGTKYSATSKKIKKLKSKKRYYVQVRSYKTISGKKYYSSWSSKKSVVTK